MTAEHKAALRGMLQRFVVGEDRSLKFVNEIEDYLRRNFQGSEIYEELVEDLATYRPGGGQFLTDEEVLKKKLEWAIGRFLFSS